jgi:small subunit ribosomal protein S25e
VSSKDTAKSAAKSAQMAKQKGASAKGGKTKKKSWTKVKVKEKLNTAVYLEKAQFERMIKEVPKILCVTRAVLIEKFKVGGSIARALIKELLKRELLVAVGQQHSTFDLYKGSQALTAT